MTAPEIPTLETPRFTCRALQDGDENAFWPAFSSEAHMRYWSCAPFTDRVAFRDYLFDERWGGRTWVAVPKGGGAPVFRMVASSPHEEVAEIGYIVAPGNEGQGIARECVSALVTHLLRAEGYQRVFADVDPRNTPSNRLLARLGFVREAHLRRAVKTHIGWCDTWYWAVLADEWPG